MCKCSYKMINKLVVFGSNGMLGTHVKCYFKENHSEITLIETSFRINKDSIQQLEEYLLSVGLNKNTCVINCAGAIPQRKPDDVWIMNAVFPHMMASICQRYGAKMIHPTTDCVFSGRRGCYLESDVHDENGEYGRSKSLGEPENCTVIRTSIIGREINNKKSFMEWICENDANVNGWTNHYWNGITCLQWSKLVAKIIKEQTFWSGVRHIYSPTRYTKYEIACMIKEVFNLGGTITPLETTASVDKTLSSLYPENSIFLIPDLRDQINQLNTFSLKQSLCI